MKFSERNYVPLSYLKNKKLERIKVFANDVREMNFMRLTIAEHWAKYYNRFSENIFYITDPFYSAMLKAEDRLTKLIEDATVGNKSSMDYGATYIIGDYVLFFYSKFQQDSEDMEEVLYVFKKDGLIVSVLFATPLIENIIMWTAKSYVPYIKDGKFNSEAVSSYVNQQVKKCLCLYTFRLYADIEVITVDSNKSKESIDCKYVNETGVDINILDSKWFRTLIHSSAFNVRGHFRLQPCGKDMAERKLIWVSEFQKSGYTRVAKILNTEA